MARNRRSPKLVKHPIYIDEELHTTIIIMQRSYINMDKFISDAIYERLLTETNPVIAKHREVKAYRRFVEKNKEM